MTSKIRTVFQTNFITHQIQCLQLPNLVLRKPSLVLRNLRPDLFHSSFSRTFISPALNALNKIEIANITKKWDSTSITWKENRKQQMINELLKLLWIGGSVFLVGDFIYLVWANQSSNKRHINKTMEKGTLPQETVLEDEFISRSEVVKRLKTIFLPDEKHSHYHVIYGECGTGKTALIIKAAREVGKGVIYVDIPSSIDANQIETLFGEALGKALNFTFFNEDAMLLQLKKKFFGGVTNKNPKWMRALMAFEHAAEVYKKKNPCNQPVIVYDNVDQLDEKILNKLQDYAKDNADKRKYITVFVSNESSVLRQMEYRSAWSRAKPPVEINDLSKEESMKYLTERCKINKVDAKKIYELVGGRILDLKNVADEFLAKQSFENIKQQFFTKIYNNFEAAEMNPHQSNHEVAKTIIKALLNSNNPLYIKMFREMTAGVEPNKLLKGNIFAYHPGNHTVTFQSRLTECYIQESANEFIN